MIPDINLDSNNSSTSSLTEGKFPTVGLVFSPDVSDGQIKRFERILKCYSDYRHYSSEQNSNEASTVVPSAPPLIEDSETRTSLEPNSDESGLTSGDSQV